MSISALWNDGEGDDRLEEITVDGNAEYAALELGQILSNRQAQAASLTVARFVAALEALHQFIRRDVERIVGDVFNRQAQRAALHLRIHIDP